MGDRLSLSVVTATPAHRKQKDQLRAGHTIPLSHSGRQTSELRPCCDKESALASPSTEFGWVEADGAAAASTLRFRDVSR